MPFVKLDTGILNSTLWVEKECRDVFITALLMAEPFEVLEPVEQIEVRSLDTTGFLVPPGWYGMVRAAGVGILRHACIEQEAGMNALDRLGLPDPESRSREFEGRRLVRINGGFIVLNFMQYRDRDYTAGTRQKNLRERQRLGIDSLLKQQEYKCGCCGDVFEKPYSKYVVQDHDHSTSKNRALLCQSCNRVVGALENQKPVHSVKAQECTAYLSRYGVTLRNASNVHRNITQAEAEAEAEAERSKPRAQDTGPVPEDSDVRVSAILDAYPKRDFSQAAQNAVINAIAREERKIEANVEGSPGPLWRATTC